ncbi:hypothetical protein ACVNS2_01645 [Paenibacillus caseinilyticus]|uniref:Lipoprotein n=1 Tax=Paenibacillus mucilaginosus K02 TaxID=997761 RepID=I0BAL4_9BACL|nr:hypothetical protein [Paenibacillus mucilaginosus]AFH59411.1 hypothetical protein B2K_01490 [Paenibacillus mucilaginosus K02]
MFVTCRSFLLLSLALLLPMPGCASRVSPAPSAPEPAIITLQVSALALNRIPVDPPAPLPAVTPIEPYAIIANRALREDVIELRTAGNSADAVTSFLRRGDRLYEIGAAGYLPLVDPGIIGIREVYAFFRKLIKISGFCGANCPVTFYVDPTPETPVLFLRIDAHGVEADADGNGTIDVIGTAGTAAESTLYTLEEDTLAASSLNRLLGAVSVRYDEAGRFFWAERPGGPARIRITDHPIH